MTFSLTIVCYSRRLIWLWVIFCSSFRMSKVSRKEKMSLCSWNNDRQTFT